MKDTAEVFDRKDSYESRREPLRRLFHETIEEAIRDHIKARIRPYIERAGCDSPIKDEGNRIFWEILSGADQERITAEIQEASKSIVASNLPLDTFARDLIAEEPIRE